MGAVDVVEGGEADDGAVDAHRVRAQFAARRQQDPVRVRARDEDLRVQRCRQCQSVVVHDGAGDPLTPLYPAMLAKYFSRLPFQSSASAGACVALRPLRRQTDGTVVSTSGVSLAKEESTPLTKLASP